MVAGRSACRKRFRETAIAVPALTFNVTMHIVGAMATVTLTPDAAKGFDKVPTGMIRRINDALERLEGWPDVSGAKPLRKELKGCFRLRCGDWRIVFRPVGDDLIVTAIDNRRNVYE
jgi:mRNA interferase RelE/StbE